MAGSNLEACGVPCSDCPVASLSDKLCYSVDVVFQHHGAEIDAAPDPGNVKQWAEESILFAGNGEPAPEITTAVGAAVTRIATRQCPAY